MFFPLNVMRICMLLWQLSMVIVVFPYMFYFIFKEVKNKNKDANFFLIGILAFLTTSVLDILVSQNLIHIPFISNYVFFTMIVGIVLLMADKFMRVTNGFEILSRELEKKVEERTKELHESLVEIKNLKVQQDGDYFLTSLLTKPFSEKNKEYKLEQVLTLETLIKQKKQFEFKNKQHEIGGDLCIYDKIFLHGEEYVVFVNGDAMGKSIQGAGGVLVFGTVFKAILERTKKTEPNQNVFPEVWLHDTYDELQKVFLSFNGSMLVSCIVGLLQIRTGMLYFFNAEHPFLVLYRDKQAQFLEKETTMKKIGTDPIFTEFYLQTFHLKQGDEIFIGSDGKDDLNLGVQEGKERKINEDETLFLRVLEQAEGEIRLAFRKITQLGDLIDDISLLKVSFLNPSPTPLNGEISRCLNEYNWSKLEELAQNNFISKDALSLLIEHFIMEKNYLRALHWTEKLIFDYPESTQHIYLASFLKKKLKQYRVALEYGKRIFYRQKNHLLNLINLADLYLMFGNKQKALEMTQLALSLSPSEQKALKLLEIIQADKEN
ncbi:MAG: SpoIIE family protein phosphatase [Leptospiraceae bacterium]|nr:SpoIIE family protein phosphatase [Leptospiraceae bacterium]